jgi:hypothetical protein
MTPRQIIAFTLFVLTTLGFSGCGRDCKKARSQILQPTQEVLRYLDTQPDAEGLALVGCPLIIQKFSHVLAGASAIRSLAESRFSQASSQCLRWDYDYRYVCYPRHDPRYPPSCYRERFEYCADWQVASGQDSEYARAIGVSHELDLMFVRASRMCGDAFSGNYPGALSASRELKSYLEARVKPDSEAVYAEACGG